MDKKLFYCALSVLAIAVALPMLASASLTADDIRQASVEELGDITYLDRLVDNIATTGVDNLARDTAINDTCLDSLAGDPEEQIDLISASIDRSINDIIAGLTISNCTGVDIDSLLSLDGLT